MSIQWQLELEKATLKQVVSKWSVDPFCFLSFPFSSFSSFQIRSHLCSYIVTFLLRPPGLAAIWIPLLFPAAPVTFPVTPPPPFFFLKQSTFLFAAFVTQGILFPLPPLEQQLWLLSPPCDCLSVQLFFRSLFLEIHSLVNWFLTALQCGPCSSLVYKYCQSHLCSQFVNATILFMVLLLLLSFIYILKIQLKGIRFSIF